MQGERESQENLTVPARNRVLKIKIGNADTETGTKTTSEIRRSPDNSFRNVQRESEVSKKARPWSFCGKKSKFEFEIQKSRSVTLSVFSLTIGRIYTLLRKVTRKCRLCRPTPELNLKRKGQAT
jgi:hypothetical protein